MPDPGYININDDPAALGTFFSDKKPDVAQPNTFSHTQQQGAQQTQQSIAYTGADPTYITRMEQFEGIKHDEIYRNAQAMSPGIMHQQADTWISIADTLSGGLLGTNLAIQKALTSGIEGQMADAALAAAQKFYQQASDVQEVISSCGHRIKAAAHAAEVVKASVPPPTAQSGTDPNALDAAQIIIAAVGSGMASAGDGDQVAYQRGVEALYRTAIDTMNNNYKPSYGPAGDGIPTFVPVDVPGGGTGGDGGTGGGGGTGGTGGGGTGNGGGTGAGQGEQATSPTDSATTQTAGLDSNSTGAQQSSGNRTPESTTNPGVNTSTSPTATTTSTRPVSPGTGGTPGGIGGTGSGNPGRTVSGLPASASSTAATSGGSSAAASTGRSGMPGMMSPGAGKKDDTESNRKTPDYLIGDHEEELLGQHLPLVPEVIGGDAPATRPDPPQRPPSRDQRR